MQCIRDRRRQYTSQAKKRRNRRKSRERRRIKLSTCKSYVTMGSVDRKSRYERSTQIHQLDDESTCSADGILESPQQIRIPKNVKKGTMQTHSLTVIPCPCRKKTDIHFGILNGKQSMFDAKYSARSKGQQAVTMSVIAYCFAYHCHPKQWTVELIDNLLDNGDRWYIECLDKLHDHSAVQGICEVLQYGKKHALNLNGKKMQVLLQEPDVVGYTKSLDPTQYNLCRGLKVFFKTNKAGLFLSRILKVVIWKDKICYYIFDPAGRDDGANANSKEGKAALMNVKDLEGVTEVLLARSVLEDQKYVLAALKVLKMVNEDSLEDFASEREMTPVERAMAEYRILSETCAIVNANLHLGDACFEQAKFRQALPVAIVAMTYAKISPPNTWNSKSLDKVLRLGSKLFLDCSNPDVLIDMTVDNIPTDIDIGPYRSEIIIYRDRVKGQLFTEKGCLLNIELGLKEFFSKEHNCGILQFNIYTLAVWKQREMYYIFDPYPCSTDGSKALQGKACVLIHLHPESIAETFTKSWDYLPATTQFQIHAFKVLKLKKNEFKANICSMSDDALGGIKLKSRSRKQHSPCLNRVDSPQYISNADNEEEPVVHGDTSGDITSLVDTILEEEVPPIPLQYKVKGPGIDLVKIADVDSPTVSATQIVPALPKSRDKTGEPPEPDPDPEPEPPTPQPVEKGEGDGGEEEAELEEEEEKEEEEKEVEVPPPPPSPEPEPELAPPEMTEDEVQTARLDVQRTVLETTDAYYKFKLRDHLDYSPAPLEDGDISITQSEEMMSPNNFKDIPDGNQIIYGSKAITDAHMEDVLPFVSIIAIVTSYKYKINSWSRATVDFVVDTGSKLYENKKTKFKFAPAHFMPKIAIGQQAYEAVIMVASDGATWQLEQALCRFFQRHDRGMITTASYSCAVFRKNGLYYLFDGSPCNGVGLRDCSTTGKPVFTRFTTLHGLVHRILYNKDGNRENQQFILSQVWVKRLLKPPRERLADSGGKRELMPEEPKPPIEEPRTPGYRRINGVYRILGTTGLKTRCAGPGVKECHFIGTVAMLMLAMHPIRTWDYRTVDAVTETGVDIYSRACNLKLCERRVIKNILLEGSFFNIAIKKLNVVNKNAKKTLEQYLKAVLSEMRYVIIRYPECSMVIYRDGDYLHLFDAYPPPAKEDPEDRKEEDKEANEELGEVASWTMYKSLEPLVRRIKIHINHSHVNDPTFYTYELTSVRKAPKRIIFQYKLSHLFKPDVNPYRNRPMSRKQRRALAKCQLVVVDEDINWTHTKEIPWSRNISYNGLGYPRNTLRTMWRDWDIESPADLYSLWGTLSPHSNRFSDKNRGKQILAINTVAIAMTRYYELSEWTTNVLDACICYGDNYHSQSMESTDTENYEIDPSDLDKKFDMYPYTFSVSFEKIIFGTVYSIHKDSMNLSRALVFFLERCRFGILVSHSKNLAFGLLGKSYFMFDCQSFGLPTFPPGQGGGYILKCESINRLLFCMIITLNIKRHGVDFALYNVDMKVSTMSE